MHSLNHGREGRVTSAQPSVRGKHGLELSGGVRSPKREPRRGADRRAHPHGCAAAARTGGWRHSSVRPGHWLDAPVGAPPPSGFPGEESKLRSARLGRNAPRERCRLLVSRHPEVRAKGAPRRMRPRWRRCSGRRPSRLADFVGERLRMTGNKEWPSSRPSPACGRRSSKRRGRGPLHHLAAQGGPPPAQAGEDAEGNVYAKR